MIMLDVAPQTIQVIEQVAQKMGKVYKILFS